MKSKKRILGIDPGSRTTGYGIIQKNEKRAFSTLDYGCIKPPLKLELTERNKIIFQSVDALITSFQPDEVVVEKQFILKINPQSGLILGMACGAAILAATLRDLPIYAYAPGQVKVAIVGHGRASKEQVTYMIKALLSLSKSPTPHDAADALGLALCHGCLQESEQHNYKI